MIAEIHPFPILKIGEQLLSLWIAKKIKEKFPKKSLIYGFGI